MVITFDDVDTVARYPSLWPGSTIVNSYADSPVLADMITYNNQQVSYFGTCSDLYLVLL
jgi:hypothetical protein